MKKVKLGEISELTIGFVGTVTTQYEENGIPFLRTLNIKPYRIDPYDLKRITRNFHESQKKSILRHGDIIMVHTGVPGFCCVIPPEYVNKHSPYSTQHGIKGAEFNDVFVILDNGNWNNYNYEQLLGTVRNQNTYDRTHKLFYVSCSRAKRNLVVYCPNFKESMRAKTEEWFGKDNMFLVN